MSSHLEGEMKGNDFRQRGKHTVNLLVWKSSPQIAFCSPLTESASKVPWLPLLQPPQPGWLTLPCLPPTNHMLTQKTPAVSFSGTVEKLLSRKNCQPITLQTTQTQQYCSVSVRSNSKSFSYLRCEGLGGASQMFVLYKGGSQQTCFPLRAEEGCKSAPQRCHQSHHVLSPLPQGSKKAKIKTPVMAVKASSSLWITWWCERGFLG